MIEYKSIHKSEWKTLNELGKSNRITSIIVEDRIILYREVKQSKEQKKAIQTKEYLEFRELYKKMSANWIYDDKFIKKYNKLVSEWLHQTIIDSIPRYEKECVLLNRPYKNASTFINQKTRIQEFRVVKTKEEEWVNDMIKDFTEYQIKEIIKTYKEWEKTQHKDITKWVLQNIIDKIVWN